MSVDLNPHVQLGFPRPLTQVVKRTLQVSNPNSQPVAFKVKTTAPKQYCVRPNSGRIEPGEKVEVQVLLQPMKEEPPTSAKCRDKFLVQSTIITPERETTSLSEIWSVVEKVHEQKIRCAFLPAASAPVPEEGEEGVGGSSLTNGATDEKYQTVRGAPNGTTADESYGSPQPGSASPNTNTTTTNPVAAANQAASNTQGSTLNKAAAGAAAAGGAVAAGAGVAYAATKDTAARAVNNVSSTVDGSNTADLQAEVSRLKQQLAESTKRGAETLQQTAADGVPVHIVAAIAFGVFAITYLFF